MKLSVKFIVALVALFAPLHAFAAVEMEFYTYGNFDEVYAALVRLELLFYGTSSSMNTDYAFLAAVIAATAVGIATAASGLRAMSGGSINPIVVFGPMFLGLVLFKALVIPSGTLYLYDPVLNKTAAHSVELPAIVVIAAGSTNIIERVMADLIENTTAYPYSSNAGGAAFNLMYANLSLPIEPDDAYVTKSLSHYISDCLPDALTSSSAATSLNQLKKDALGCSSTDALQCVIEGFGVNTATTTYFDDSNRAGISDTCNKIWDDHLKAALNGVSFAGAKAAVCNAAHYQTKKYDDTSGTYSVDPDETQACEDRFEDVEILLGGDGSNAGGNPSWTLKQAYLAQTINAVVLNDSPDKGTAAAANLSMINDGLGASVAANEWIPHIRGMVTALSLGIIPFVALFIVTPLVWRALGLILGLMVFISVWGVVEAIIHVATVDAATQYLIQASQYKWGLDSVALGAPAALKILAMFGKARAMGIVITGSITYGLFKLSDYGFANMASGMQGTVERHGSGAANQAATYQGKMSSASSLVNAGSTDSQIQAVGMNGMTQAASWRNMSHDFQSLTEQKLMTNSGQMTAAAGAAAFGGVNAASTTARPLAVRNAVVEGGGKQTDVGAMTHLASETAITGAEQTLGGQKATKAVANASGRNVTDQEYFSSFVEGSKRIGGNEAFAAFAKDNGFSINNLEKFNSTMSLLGQTGASQAKQQTLETLGSTLKDKHGITATPLQMSQLIEGYNQAHSAAAAGNLGTQGEIDKYAHLASYKEISQMRGFQAYADSKGIPAEGLFDAMGKWGAISGGAPSMALLSKENGRPITDSNGNVKFDARFERWLDNSLQLQASKEVGAGRTRVAERDAHDLGEIQTGAAMGQLGANRVVQELTGRGVFAVAESTAGQITVPVTPGNSDAVIAGLTAAGVELKDEHKTAINGGASVHLDTDPKSGKILNVSTIGGVSTETRFSSSDTTSDYHNAGLNIDSNSASSKLLTVDKDLDAANDGTRRYNQAMEFWGNIMSNKSDAAIFANQVASFMEVAGGTSAGSNDIHAEGQTTTVSANIGVNGARGSSTKPGDIHNNQSASVGASAGTTGSSSRDTTEYQSAQYSGNLAKIKEQMENARIHALEQGLNEDEEVRIFARNMGSIYGGLVSDIDIAAKKVHDTPLSGASTLEAGRFRHSAE